MKTLTFLIIGALLTTFQAHAAIDDSTNVPGATGPHIVCTINNDEPSSFTSGEESNAVSCTCTEVYAAPEIDVVSNSVTHTILVLGAVKGDQIYILASTGEIIMSLLAPENNPRIDVSKLIPGTYTIGVQSY